MSLEVVVSLLKAHAGSLTSPAGQNSRPLTHAHSRLYARLLWHTSDFCGGRRPQSYAIVVSLLFSHPPPALHALHWLNPPSHIELGYSITLTLAPKDFGGRLWLNFARTTPELPCGLVTLPQITLILLPCRSLAALYTNAIRLPR